MRDKNWKAASSRTPPKVSLLFIHKDTSPAHVEASWSQNSSFIQMGEEQRDTKGNTSIEVNALPFGSLSPFPTLSMHVCVCTHMCACTHTHTHTHTPTRHRKFEAWSMCGKQQCGNSGNSTRTMLWGQDLLQHLGVKLLLGYLGDPAFWK